MDLKTLDETRQFLEKISSSVHNIICSQFPKMTREEREDVDHEVKLKIWKMVSRGKKIDNLKSYLWRVVYTTALDVLGNRMNTCSLDELAVSRNCDEVLSANVIAPDRVLEKKELQMMIEKAVNMLPERRKTVLQLHLLGLGLKETADFLEWSENQVRHLLYRGQEELKEILKDLRIKESI